MSSASSLIDYFRTAVSPFEAMSLLSSSGLSDVFYCFSADAIKS